MSEPLEIVAFGEEGCHCPKCGSRADYDLGTAGGYDLFAAYCLNKSCDLVFNACFADPQCGECREFLEDTTAEDDSLCPKCAGKEDNSMPIDSVEVTDDGRVNLNIQGAKVDENGEIILDLSDNPEFAEWLEEQTAQNEAAEQAFMGMLDSLRRLHGTTPKEEE